MSMCQAYESLTARKVVDVATARVFDDGSKAVLAIFTDEVRWMGASEFASSMQDENRLSCLLELRAHNLACEFHAVRSSVERNFVARLREDGDEDADFGFYKDEVQWLDIDNTAPGTDPSSYRYQSIAGGPYTLPVANAKLVTVRDYYEFDKDDGLARLVDFRIVGFGDQREVSAHA